METPGESASAYAAARSSGGGGQEAAKKEGKRRFNEYFRRKSRSDKATAVERQRGASKLSTSAGSQSGTRARRRRGRGRGGALLKGLFRNNHREIKPNSNFGTRGLADPLDRLPFTATTTQQRRRPRRMVASAQFPQPAAHLRGPHRARRLQPGSPYFPSDHFGICCDWHVAHPTGGEGGAGGGRGGGGGNGRSIALQQQQQQQRSSSGWDSDDSF